MGAFVGWAIGSIALAVAFLGACPTQAGQTAIPNYDTARNRFFWAQLYTDGGTELYCAAAFAAGERRAVGKSLSVEHAYPADWIAEANGCVNRNECPIPEYGFAEADLHNLWPAISNINSSRQDLRFGEIPGEGARRFTDYCPDYERTQGAAAVVEPRDDVKGDLARSVFYMSVTYDLPLRGMGPMLVRWHAADPPDEIEQWRNDLIEDLQGTRNGFIDSPETVRLLEMIETNAAPADTPSITAGELPMSPWVQEAQVTCCKVCRTGKACGNSCINRSYTCTKPPGCACDAP